MKTILSLIAAAAIYAMTGCANLNGTTKIDPQAVAIASEVLQIGAAEYARQHPVPHQVHPAK